MIALLILLQMSFDDYWKSDEEAFASYRACMLARAPELAMAPDDAKTLEAAARSACQVEHAAASALIAANAALIASEPKKRGYNPVRPDPQEHFEEMKQTLSDDFAAAVVAHRIRQRSDAQD